MKSLIHQELTQFIKADINNVLDAIQYENVHKWSKKLKSLKIIEKNDNKVIAKLDNIRIMGIRLSVTVHGEWQGNMVIEDISISDGTETKEVVSLKKINDGTELTWKGDLVKYGKLTRWFGPLMGYFFKIDFKRDFKRLAKYLEK